MAPSQADWPPYSGTATTPRLRVPPLLFDFPHNQRAACAALRSRYRASICASWRAEGRRSGWNAGGCKRRAGKCWLAGYSQLLRQPAISWQQQAAGRQRSGSAQAAHSRSQQQWARPAATATNEPGRLATRSHAQTSLTHNSKPAAHRRLEALLLGAAWQCAPIPIP